MIEYKLTLPGVKPYSLNSAYYKKTFNMTKECRDWRKTVIRALKAPENQSVMDSIRDIFVPDIHGVVAKINYGIVYTSYFTVKGDVSAKSMDLSNVEKLLIDIIFDERFFTRGEIRNCNINDKYILRLNSEKNPSLSSSIEVLLYVYPRTTLAEFKRLHNI